MNTTIASSRVSTSSTKTPVRRFAQRGSLVLGSLFVLGVLLQVFLAGGGIFASPSWWGMHEAFGMGMSLLPLAFLLLAWIGQLGRRSLWLSGLAFVLVVLQTFLITLPGTLGVPLLSALHPVNALVIFGLALWLLQSAWQAVRSDRQS
ncbi:MAG TPA: DUF6220 domain-containing protein [Ktedonobacteraceae bacterium]|nr:DUF6220 domain-containing protein [Ktedonobacteraceae bacterium]